MDFNTFLKKSKEQTVRPGLDKAAPDTGYFSELGAKVALGVQDTEPDKFTRETDRWISDGGGRKSTARSLTAIQTDLDILSNRERALQREQSILLAPDALTDNSSRVEEIRKEIEELAQKRKTLETEKYVEEIYASKGKRDSFSGQFDANMELGRIVQDQGRAWNDYLENPTDANRKRAELYDQAVKAFQTRNYEALDDKGQVAPLLSKDLANYLPQLVDQTKSQAAGAIAGGVIGGLATGGAGTLQGIKIGSALGSGRQMFEVTRGAAFKRLLDLGVDEALARDLAQDEGIVNGIIESGDTYLEWLTLGGTKAVTGVASKIAPDLLKKASTKAGKSALKKLTDKVPALVKALAGYLGNIPQEGLEEGWQEGVSLANDARALEGKDTGILGLFVEGGKAALDPENREQVWEATKGGMKIAAMVGGAQVVTNQILASGSKPEAKTTVDKQVDKVDNKPIQVSEAASETVKQVAQQEKITRTENPESNVLDTATTLIMERQGLSLKVAQTRAEIMQKLITGEEVKPRDLNRIEPTSPKTKAIFTELSGVQFPEGVSGETLFNLYRSAPQVAKATQEARVAEAEQAVARAQEVVAQEEARAEMAEDVGLYDANGQSLLTPEQFATTYQLTPEEAAERYPQYLYESATIEFKGQRVNFQQFTEIIQHAPDGDKLTEDEIVDYFRNGLAREQQIKEARHGRQEDLVHRGGRHGETVQSSRREHSRLSGETGRAEGDDGARGGSGAAEDGSRVRSGTDGLSGRAVREKVSDSDIIRRVTLPGDVEADEIREEFYTPEMQAQVEKFAPLGTKVHFLLRGYPIPGTDQYAGGIAVMDGSNRDVYLQATSSLGVDKLANHELVHIAVAADPDLKDAILSAVQRVIPREELGEMVRAYRDYYGGAYSDSKALVRELFEEIAADAYAGINSYGVDAAQYQDAIREVVDPWVQTRTETYRAEMALTDDAGSLVVESDGQGYSRFSMSTYQDSGRDTLTKWMSRAVLKGDLTQEDADDIVNTMDLIYDTCEEYRDQYAPFSAWSDAKVVVNEQGKPVFSVVKKNGEYPMNLDFSLVCKKRRTLDAVLNELVRRGFADNVDLGQENIVKVNEIIRKYGFETACDLCFVDARRFRQADVADTFVKLYNDLVLSMVPENSGLQPQYFNFGGSALVANEGTGIHELPNSELDFTRLDEVLKTHGKDTVEAKVARLLKNSPTDRKLTMRGDFLSTRGFDAVHRQNPRLLKLYNSKKGTGGPKAAVSDVQYLNEVLKSRTFNAEKAYAVGGVRIQSFSDYVPRMVFDYVQMIADLSAKKLPAQAYTKEELFVKQFGLTGMKINMSLIPKVVDGGIAPGLDANGDYAWADESFDFEEAKRIQSAEGYSRNCGTIAVGVSDEHIRTLMADPEIRMVIPYHKSGLNAIVAKMNKIDQFVNYEDFQNTRHENGTALDKKKDKKLLNEMPDFNSRMRELGDPRAAAEEYVRWCEEHDLLPKFDQFAYKQIDGMPVERDGQRVVDENYYKLLEDFTVYDNGQYVEQTGLTMTFPDETSEFGSMSDLIKRGLEEDAVLEGKRTEKVGPIVDEIMKFKVGEKSGASVAPETVGTFRDTSTGENVRYSVADEAPKKTIQNVYKAFYARDGKLYPPMVANLTAEEQKTALRGGVSGTMKSLDTPVGVWLTADVGKLAMDAEGNPIRNTRGRLAVVNEKGGGTLAYRPGWHLGEWPDAKQFNKDSKIYGKKSVMPDGLVFARCEIAADIDYQLDAMSLGMKENGKYDRTQAGLPMVPVDGYYKYRTNADPNTAPWYITGAMRVVEILDDDDCAKICAEFGVEPSPRESGKKINLADYGLKRGPVTPTEDLVPYQKTDAIRANEAALQEALNAAGYENAYVSRALNFDNAEIAKEFARNRQDINEYREKAKDWKPLRVRKDTQTKYSVTDTGLSFADQVDLAAQNKLNEFLAPGTDSQYGLTSSAVYVTKEPNSLMQELGYGDFALVMTQRHLRQILGRREGADGSIVNEHNHQLTPEQVKQMPELLEKPAAVIKATRGRSNTLVFVTTERDYAGRPIIIPVKANGTDVAFNGVTGPAHIVTSMYGHDAFDKYFEDAVKQGRVAYLNKERIDPMLTIAGDQRSSLLSAVDSDTIMSEVEPKVKDVGVRKFSITPEFEKWYKEQYGEEDVTDAQLKRRLETQERRAEQAEESAKAAEFKRVMDTQNGVAAWSIYHQKKMREQKRVADAKLAAARKEKVEAVRSAVAETKMIERAKAEVQHDADRMAERRNAAKRLRTQENAYKQKVGELKENAKLKRNAAKATLRDKRLADRKRAEIESEQGLVDTIRKNPKQRSQVERIQESAQNLRTLGRSAYRNFVNVAEAIDRFSKRQVSDMRAGTLVNVVGSSASTTEAIFKTGLVNRAGDRIGDSMRDVFLCWDDAHKNVDENKQALLQDFMLHWHNIDRMSIVTRAEARLETFELNNEWLRDMDTKEFARLVAMTGNEAAKLGKEAAQQKAFEYQRLIHEYNEAANKPIFADADGKAVTAETSQKIVDKYLEENPWLLEKSKGIHEWWDLFMKNWAVGDTLSGAEYLRMRDMYPHYVPTYRTDKNGVGGANFVGLGGANVSKAVKRAKGSFAEVANIEDSFANMVSKIVKLNRVNELYMNIIDTAMLDEDGVFADLAYFDWDSSWQTGAYAEALGGELTETVDDADKAGLEKVGNDYKLTAWREGRKLTAFISEDLYKSIGGVTGHLANDLEQNLLKVGNALTGPMKTAITGINPNFALRNISRDLPTAIVNSISGMAFPKYWARAAAEMGQNSEHWQHFKALGGTNATYYNDGQGFAKAIAAGKGVVAKTVDKVGWFNEVTEAQTRFAEYLATVDRLGDTYEARLQGIKNSAEVTVDFSRKGRYGKVINAWVPYWNPAVQGIDKVARSVIESPDGSAVWKQASKTLGRAAMTTVLLEAILHGVLKALDRDDEWEELNDRTKDTYYCIPLKDSHTFLKIPKNREWGAILGTPFMRMLEYANGRENPFENYIETAIEPNFLPPAILRPDAGGGFSTDMIGFSQMNDLSKNEDFAGRAIVPYVYQQGSPSQQYDADTSWVAKKLGDLFNWSPMQIDYLIGDYFGDFGDIFRIATSDATWSGDKDITEAALDVVASPWTVDSRYSNQGVSKYYDTMDELKMVVNDKKNQLGNEAYKQTVEYQTQKAVTELYGDQISELNRVVRELPDGDEKDTAKAQIAQLTAEALQYYDDCMAGRIGNPVLDAEYKDFSGTVSKELIRLDSLSGEYKFKPTGNPSAKYTDPQNKQREYVLDDAQKDYFKQLYREKYDELFLDVIQSGKYLKAKDADKATMLEDTRDDVLDATKEEFFDWLRKNGVRSIPKTKK